MDSDIGMQNVEIKDVEMEDLEDVTLKELIDLEIITGVSVQILAIPRELLEKIEKDTEY